MKQRNFLKNENGLWEKDGEEQPCMVEVKPDKSLALSIIRHDIAPHTLVVYDPQTVSRSLNDCGKDIFLIKVCQAECPSVASVPVPLSLLMFSEEQKRRLQKAKRIPDYAFTKHAVALHVEDESPIQPEEAEAVLAEDE